MVDNSSFLFLSFLFPFPSCFLPFLFPFLLVRHTLLWQQTEVDEQVATLDFVTYTLSKRQICWCYIKIGNESDWRKGKSFCHKHWNKCDVFNLLAMICFNVYLSAWWLIVVTFPYDVIRGVDEEGVNVDFYFLLIFLEIIKGNGPIDMTFVSCDPFIGFSVGLFESEIGRSGSVGLNLKHFSAWFSSSTAAVSCNKVSLCFKFSSSTVAVSCNKVSLCFNLTAVSNFVRLVVVYDKVEGGKKKYGEETEEKGLKTKSEIIITRKVRERERERDGNG